MVFDADHLVPRARKQRGPPPRAVLEDPQRMSPGGEPPLDRVHGTVGPPGDVQVDEGADVVDPGEAVGPVPQPVRARGSGVGERAGASQAAAGCLQGGGVRRLGADRRGGCRAPHARTRRRPTSASAVKPPAASTRTSRPRVIAATAAAGPDGNPQSTTNTTSRTPTPAGTGTA